MADDKKVIFSMVGVSKSFQNNKQVLKDIYLSFFYGAKIGIIGLNGSGKSTLMKIIAGLDKNYQGEVVFSPGYSVGYLAQEPQLDDTKTVKEVVMEGVQQVVDTLAEYEEINNKFGLPVSAGRWPAPAPRRSVQTDASSPCPIHRHLGRRSFAPPRIPAGAGCESPAARARSAARTLCMQRVVFAQRWWP